MDRTKLKELISSTKELSFQDLRIFSLKISEILSSKEKDFLNSLKEDIQYQEIKNLFKDKIEFDFNFKNSKIIGYYSLNEQFLMIPNMSKNLDLIHVKDEEITNHYNSLVESGYFDKIREKAVLSRTKFLKLLNNLGTKYDLHHSYLGSLLLKDMNKNV